MTTMQIVGVIASLVGLVAVIYVFKVYSRFMKELKTGFAGIAFGILFGFLSILAITIHIFGFVTETWNHILVLSFLGIAAILIAFGSNKILKTVSNVDKKEEK